MRPVSDAILRDTISTSGSIRLMSDAACCPGLRPAHLDLSSPLFYTGPFEASLAELKAIYGSLGDREVGAALVQGHAQAGYSGAMKRAADVLAARSRKALVLPVWVAGSYVRAGERARALEWLERALEARDPNLPSVNPDPDFDGLRSEPRFQAILRRMNLPQ
jgi:serine/threonine-protein kinase